MLKERIKSLFGRYWWLTPLVIFLVWRILLEIIGRVNFAILEPFIKNPWHDNSLPLLWARYDSGWYASIIEHGYHQPHIYSLDQPPLSNVAFFPVYPILWQIIQMVTQLRMMVAGILTANISAFAFSLVFFRWLEKQYNKKVAVISLISLFVFPWSFFLISAYSESTFLLLIALTFWLAYEKKFTASAFITALATATRSLGILLWPTLLWIWWRERDKNKINKGEIISLLTVPPLGLLFFSFFMWLKMGDPLSWLHAQTAWGHNLTSPVILFSQYLHTMIIGGEINTTLVIEFIAFIFVLINLPKIWKLYPPYGLFTFLYLLIPAYSGTLLSFPRFTLAILPLFIILGKTHKRWLYLIYLFISVQVLVFSIGNFVSWHWAN